RLLRRRGVQHRLPALVLIDIEWPLVQSVADGWARAEIVSLPQMRRNIGDGQGGWQHQRPFQKVSATHAVTLPLKTHRVYAGIHSLLLYFLLLFIYFCYFPMGKTKKQSQLMSPTSLVEPEWLRTLSERQPKAAELLSRS